MSERKLPPWTPSQERVGNVVIRIMSALNICLISAEAGGASARRAGVLVPRRTRRSSRARRHRSPRGRNAFRCLKAACRRPAWYLNSLRIRGR
jgi:hypothetical protein